MPASEVESPHSHPPARFEPGIPKTQLKLDKEPGARELRIIQVFFHADMRLGHNGLEVHAKRFGIDVNKLMPGQFVVFVNSAEDKVKVFASNCIVAYMLLPAGRKVDHRVIREIPRAFNSGGRLSYDSMLEKVVNEHFAQRTARKGMTHAKEKEGGSSSEASA